MSSESEPLPEPVVDATVNHPDASTDAEPAPAGGEAASVAPRRIPIGTQRPGVRPPSLGPKVRYVSESATAQAAAPGAVPAADHPASARDPAAVAQPTGPAGEPGPAAPATASPGPRTGGERRGDRPDRRRDKPSPASFTDVLPPARRVAIPNLRAALDDDLEADYAAAVEGVAVDDLLVAEMPAKSDAPLEPGTRVAGTVLSVAPDTAFIDLGARRQGAMKLASLLEAGIDIPEVGQSVEVSVGSRNEEDGLYDVALANRAVAVEDWTQLQAGMIVAAQVKAANKGGLECDVAGLRGFMPASLVSTWRIENLEELVGQTLESLVTEIVPEARRLVLSRRAVIERQAADAREKLLESLEPGTALEGTVRSVRDFGAFVDIGDGVEGLAHVSELSWERVSDPAAVLAVGQKVRAIVKKIDRQTGKIGLSLRDLVESPWKRAAEKYHVGATVKGTVSRIAQFGAFVKLEPGVEGLVHVSELATRHIRSVADVVKEGQAVECRVLAVDPDAQRMSLSIKAIAAQAAETASEAADDAAAGESAAPPPARKRSAPLKGGVGGESQGARFGLKW